MGCCIVVYSDVLPLNIVSSESFIRHELPALLATHFVDDHMEKALFGVQTSMYSVVAPRELFSVKSSTYATSMVFYMNGSFIDRYAGFAIHLALKRLVLAIRYRVRLVLLLFVTTQHIEEVI
jgi:hypothetical protein